MSLFFTKCLLHTPPSFKAVGECFSVNPSMYSPFRNAFCLAIKRQQVLSTKLHSLGQSAFWRQTPAQTGGKSVWVYAKLDSPICDAHCLSVMCKYLVAACVAVLLCSCRPVAIGWTVVCDAFRTFSARIVTVVVSSFDTVFRSGLVTHVIVKCIEQMPSFANSDIATTVAIETSRCWVVAALVELSPCAILWRSRHAVRRRSLCGSFFTEAPTTSRMSSAKAATSHNRSCSAVALAMPKSFSELVEPSVRQNSPATEVFAPGQVFHAGRNSNTIIFSHLTVPRILDVVRATQRLMTVGSLAFYRTSLTEPSGKWR